MADTDTFQDLRRPLLGIAYRMTGSVSEAEDIVQEAFLRYYRASGEDAEIRSTRSYLAAVTTRLAIDHLRSARVRRERYVGAWLPEPLVAGTDDAAEHAEMADSVSMAFLLVLERLSPVERAVFLLRDVFGYGYDEIAEIVGKREDNCRQLAARARAHVREHRPRFDPSPEQREELGRRFLAAVEDGDTEGLVSMLAADAVMNGDGGGKAPALSHPVEGAERVARFLAGLGRQGRRLGLRLRQVVVNGQPGAIVVDGDGLAFNVFTIDVADGRVHAVHSVVNPDKLGHLGPVGDLNRLLREGAASPSGIDPDR
jgi:RNA polymerase sigma-70 factor (ECF subfamily)